MAKKKSTPKVGKARGRPRLELKKVPFQVMLDPRYKAHFLKRAAKLKVQPQDLARMALGAMVPDPFLTMFTAKKLRDLSKAR